MNVWAVIFLSATAAVGAVLWYALEHRRNHTGTVPYTLLAAVPAGLLGAAALFGLAGGPVSDSMLNVARAVAVAAAVPGGSLVATALLRVADRGTGIVDDGAATETVSDPNTLRGGTSIGALERVGVAVTLLAGWPEGLVLVLGVKGLGRYPELRRPAAAERFIIGTLASVLWAVAVVGVVQTLRG